MLTDQQRGFLAAQRVARLATADGDGRPHVVPICYALTGDSVYPNPDRSSIAFMRSYPNHLPLSGAVALRIAAQLRELKFDRIYGNFNNVIASGAKAVLHASAQRHAAWVRGDYDHLT